MPQLIHEWLKTHARSTPMLTVGKALIKTFFYNFDWSKGAEKENHSLTVKKSLFNVMPKLAKVPVDHFVFMFNINTKLTFENTMQIVILNWGLNIRWKFCRADFIIWRMIGSSHQCLIWWPCSEVPPDQQPLAAYCFHVWHLPVQQDVW